MGIQKLDRRRKRGDLIQFYKISRGLEKVNWFKKPTTIPGIGGKREQIRGEIVKSCLKREFFFINRIINDWNSLPDEVAHAQSVCAFKEKLDKVLPFM